MRFVGQKLYPPNCLCPALLGGIRRLIFDQVSSVSHYSRPLLLLFDRLLFLLSLYRLVISSPRFALSVKGRITGSQRKGAKHWLTRRK